MTGLTNDKNQGQGQGLMEWQIPAQNVLDDMSVEEERAELILKEAESHQTTHVPERIQPHLSWPGLRQWLR